MKTLTPINIAWGIMIVLVALLIVLGVNLAETPAGTVLGKGIDENGNMYLMISDCTGCDTVSVKVNQFAYESYETGEAFP